jgi:glutaminyl-peptide cyclotransferase
LDGVKILIGKTCLILVLLSISFMSCGGQSIPEFDKDEAFNYIKQQCDFGSRNPNSEAHKKCEEFLYRELSATTDICRRQSFTYIDTIRQDTLYLTNLIASYNTKNTTKRVLLCAHWDSRPWADYDPDSSKHSTPVMGANDGASGVAVLLTIAKIFKDDPPPVGVDIILFDGEDYGQYGSQDQWLLGSKYFVSHIGNYKPSYVLLLDMIGDIDLNIHKEYYSQTYAGWFVSKIWDAAALEKAEHFYPDIMHSVYDDHIPFIERGIPAADLIDMDYQWWHTTADTPDKCSAESLAEVGRVVLRLLYGPNQL